MARNDQADMRASDLDRAVRALKAGKPVLFPTDTVVGLGVAVRHCASPALLFELKGRPAGKPVAWLVADAEALDEYGIDVPETARKAVAEHWPGAFTAIVKAGDAVPAAYRSAAGTIGLRVPASESVRALIRAVGCPLATTSANLSGQAAPRSLHEVPDALRAAVCALDLPEEGDGIASTVVDYTGDAPVVLRAASRG